MLANNEQCLDNLSLVCIIFIKGFKHIPLNSKKLIAGDYFIKNDRKAIIVRDITVNNIIKRKFNIKDLALNVWVRQSLNGQENRKSLKDIWFPWRSQNAFKDINTNNDGNTWSLSECNLR